MFSLRAAFVVISLYAVLHNGDALRCWSCSSDVDAPCADFFNTTRVPRYRQYPTYSGNANQVELQTCEEARETNYYPHQQRQKPVCMKKKQTTHGRTTYIRQCRFIPFNENVGECPTETTSSATSIDFCEYCDSDECNTAQTLTVSISLIALLPIFTLLLKQ